MGIGLGEEVGEVPTGRRIVLPGEDASDLHHRRAANFRPTFHSSPLLDPGFDVPKSHYGLTLKQMESLGLHEHAILNGSPDPVSSCRWRLMLVKQTTTRATTKKRATMNVSFFPLVPLLCPLRRC